MQGVTLWLLLAAPVTGEPPPVAHFDAVTAARQAAETGQAAELAMQADGHDRLTVPVRLGTSGPFRFLVDTGSNHTLVSRELAQALGLREQAMAVLHSATGQSQVRVAHLPELSAGRRVIRNIHAPLLGAADMGADGILGIDSLRSQRVVLDFARGQLSVLADQPAEALEGDAIVVRAKRREGRLVVSDAEVGGERVSLILDTGSSLTVGNRVLRDRLARHGALRSMGPIDLVSVTGAALRGELTEVRSLVIGGARLEPVQIVFVEAHTFGLLKLSRKPAVLLGMNAMRGFDQVAIDFGARTLSLVLPKARKPGA